MENVITPEVSEINKNFIIRWKRQDEKKVSLIGAGKYIDLVGEELQKKHFSIVLYGEKDKYIFQVRKKLTITFVAK